ncbi:MAG: sodium:proton antiporter [Flavobacteriales bacterium]|nr:sodium:proton antiporter [Flavobacteriales bacterium]
MQFYATFALLITLAALFAWANHRWLRMPPSIGLLLITLLFSLGTVGLGRVAPELTAPLVDVVQRIDLSKLLLEVMLSFLLFAGAIHIKWADLSAHRLSILLFSTVSVALSTVIVGIVFHAVLPLFGLELPLVRCLLFGALISPTDPIAVLSILKRAGVPQALEMKVAGESLFNDGVAVVLFLSIAEASADPADLSIGSMALLFLREAVGGIVLGLVIGYLGFRMMRRVDEYKVEVMLSLAMVMGGYALAHQLHVSGPLAMVAAGIFIGNLGRAHAMSAVTVEYVDKFWEIVDELLNAVLFVLIGLELLVISLPHGVAGIVAFAIPTLLVVRFISLWLPAQLARRRERNPTRTILLLTWGGLRGGISIALALSLPRDEGREMWVAITYAVVAFSIVVQGLTVGRLAKRLQAEGE